MAVWFSVDGFVWIKADEIVLSVGPVNTSVDGFLIKPVAIRNRFFYVLLLVFFIEISIISPGYR